jgi:hypothetical protein
MFNMLQVNDKTLEVADFLENGYDDLLQKWQEREYVQYVFGAHNIDPEFFIKHFGSRVLTYFIGVLRGENKIGECPAMSVLILFFKKKKIKLHEIFLCCSGFKNTIVNEMVASKENPSKELLTVAETVFDLNFSGVIQDYIALRFSAKEGPSCDLLYNKCSNSMEVSEAEPEIAIPLPEVTEEVVAPVKPRETQVYDQEFFPEDIQEFTELEEDVGYIAEKLELGSFDGELAGQLAAKLMKYGSTILSNPAYNELGESIVHLAQQFDNVDNHLVICRNLRDISLFVNCFVNDLVIWRKALLETGIEDPHYYDQSIISNVKQLETIIEGGEAEDDGFELF